MKWVFDNWSLLVILVAVCTCALVSTRKFANAPTEEQVAKVKEWLLFAVIQAEKELGGGTGQIKLRYVYDMFVAKFPTLVDIVSFSMFSMWVDEVLRQMRHILNTNLDVKAYVEDKYEHS